MLEAEPLYAKHVFLPLSYAHFLQSEFHPCSLVGKAMPKKRWDQTKSETPWMDGVGKGRGESGMGFCAAALPLA